MANSAERNMLNPSGAWYVDSGCIGCALCASLAPSNFKMSEDGSTAYVSKQPSGASELEASASALSDCPVQAIGDDG
jgi:ferredoxin